MSDHSDAAHYEEYFAGPEGPYVHQRFVIVEADGPDPSIGLGPRIAIGATFEDAAIEPDALRRAVLDVVGHAPRVVDDKRSEFDWGASGPLVQELLITIGTGAAGGVLSAGVVGAVKALAQRIRKTADPDLPERETDADLAWTRFAEFVETAFGTKRLRATTIQRFPSGWHIEADADASPIEGGVSLEGDVIAARWMGSEGDPPLPDLSLEDG